MATDSIGGVDAATPPRSAIAPGASEPQPQAAPDLQRAGRVVDAEGAPLAALPVTVLGGGEIVPGFDWREHLRMLQTDRDGRFEVELLAPGSYTVLVSIGERRFEFPAIEVESGRTTSARLVLP